MQFDTTTVIYGLAIYYTSKYHILWCVGQKYKWFTREVLQSTQGNAIAGNFYAGY